MHTHTYVCVNLSASNAYSQKSLDLGFQTVGCEQMRNMQEASPPNPGKRRREKDKDKDKDKDKEKIVPHRYIDVDIDIYIHICTHMYTCFRGGTLSKGGGNCR